MNYIWEIALCAADQGLPFEDVTLVPAKVPNPYVEVAFSDINQVTLYDEPIEVNVLYRFWYMFAEIVGIDFSDYLEMRDALINITLHYITELDLRQGLSRHEYYIKFLKRDVLAGKYGQSIKENLQCFEKWQRRYVLNSMFKLYLTGPSHLALKTLLKSIYPKSILYALMDTKKQLLIYLGIKQTETLVKQIQFICDMFVPLEYTVHLFWEKHFGIININETMIPDEIMIF